MAVKIHIHTTHQQFTNGQEAVPVTGNTVGECLNQLIRQYPNMEQALFGKKNQLLNNVEILVNQTSAYPQELQKPVQDGDDIYLLLMLSGG